MSPTIDVGISTEVFLAVVGGMATILGVTMLLVYKAIQKRIGEKFQHTQDLVVQSNERVSGLFKSHERLRDKWDDFLREYLKIDNTRGQKVDALFRVVDQMQDTFKEIRPTLNSKIEDSFARALSELKVYVRDQIREEIND